MITTTRYCKLSKTRCNNNNKNNSVKYFYIAVILLLLLLHSVRSSSSGSTTTTTTPTLTRPELPTEQQQQNGRQYSNQQADHIQKRYRSSDKKSFNFAAYDVGAKILGSSPEAKKVSRILNEDKDNYMLIPRTAEKKWVTIELSEEILMHSFALANFEYYSCSPRIFQVLGSREFPCRAPKCYWEVLGTYEAHNTRTVQTFMLQRPSITRYVKFLFLTHYGDGEYFCTLSLIRVHGSTLLEDLKAALYDMGPHGSLDGATAPDHGHHIYTQSNHINRGSDGTFEEQNKKSGGGDESQHNNNNNHLDSARAKHHVPTFVTNPSQVDANIFNAMKNVQKITSDDDSESMLEIPILDPDLIRSIMDNMNIPKIREQQETSSRSSELTNNQCSMLNPFMQQSLILVDVWNVSETSCVNDHSGRNDNLTFNNTSISITKDAPDTDTLEKTTTIVAERPVDNLTNSSSHSVLSETKSVLPIINYYQKRVNMCLLSELEFWQLDSSKPSSLTNESMIQKPDNQHRIDAIQPTHVEPDKRMRSSKPESISEEEEGEEVIAPPQRARKSYEETSDNILKSLLLKIQKQEDYSISLGRNLQKVHNKYVEAFRDIQNVLNKTAHEHNVLASAVYSLSHELKHQIIEDIRQEYERELHKVQLMNEYKMELLLHNLTETISILRGDTTRSVNGYKKFMVVCMTIPLIFMVFVLLLCIPTATKTDIAKSNKLNSRAAKLAKLIYPLDDSRKQQRGQLYFDSDADDEDDITDIDDEDRLVAAPKTPESKKPISSNGSVVEQSPANKKPISLVNHLVSYLTDSETTSRPASPKRGYAPNFATENTKTVTQQYKQQSDQQQQGMKDSTKIPPPIDTSRMKAGNTRDIRGLTTEKLSQKITPTGVAKPMHPRHKNLKRSLSLGEDLIFERRAASTNTKSPAIPITNGQSVQPATGKRKTKRTKKAQ